MKKLHNHPRLEEELGLDINHVIVDRHDWEDVSEFLNSGLTPREVSETWVCDRCGHNATSMYCSGCNLPFPPRAKPSSYSSEKGDEK